MLSDYLAKGCTNVLFFLKDNLLNCRFASGSIIFSSDFFHVNLS